MYKVFVMPYKGGSRSAKIIATAIKALRIKLRGSKFRPSIHKVVVNWGNSNPPIMSYNWINNPRAVGVAANKIRTLKTLKEAGVSAPNFYLLDNFDQINKLIEAIDKGKTVFARLTVTGHGGAGIEIIDKKPEGWDEATEVDKFNLLPQAALYTEYFNGKDEYRVHVCDGKVIDVQQKKKHLDAEKVNFKIRNHEGGFVFCREGVEPPQCVLDESVKAVQALGLDFGAVDVRYRQHDDKACVLEVNAAPGLEGTTIEKYSLAIGELLEKSGVQ